MNMKPQHLQKHDVSYFAHWKRAMQMSIALFIHAWIPDVLETYASEKMKKIPNQQSKLIKITFKILKFVK